MNKKRGNLTFPLQNITKRRFGLYQDFPEKEWGLSNPPFIKNK